jgi:glycosyltransferase involved in cell wall biosynthesis
VNNVSIYLAAGDIADAVRRYDEGRDQIYQSHNEMARLIHNLLASNAHVKVHSFVTPERREETLGNGSRFISLGARDFSAKSLLSAVVAEDDADAIIVHFPNLELLRAAAATKSRVLVLLADSYNGTGLRSTLGKWRAVSLLNNPRFELVANHCLPATEHLARIGVKREKLIAYDYIHPFDPASYKPRRLVARRPFEAVYAGSIIETKGIPDLIRAIALLREQGIEVHCSLAGLGDIDAMLALGATLGVSDLLSFRHLVGNTEVFNSMVMADVVVVPSRPEYPEGFPLAIFEGIASRTPIVCSNHPMFREVMVDGRNASVFSAGDYRSFAAAMRRTLTDPVLYAALSTNALLTWAALKGPADWRTLIFKWIVEGRYSPWIRERMLIAAKPLGAQVG